MTDKASTKIVICGAGLAGVSAAYYLVVEHGCRDIIVVERDNPLSLTSGKSTEAYRNWWPGPDRDMTLFMDRSIDLMEEIARATTNRINMNRRGYLFATADSAKIPFLKTSASLAETRGGGPVAYMRRRPAHIFPRHGRASICRSQAPMSLPTQVSFVANFPFSRLTPSASCTRDEPAG